MGAMEWKKLSVDELCPAAYNPRKKLKAGDKEYEKMARILCEKVDAGLYVVTHIDDPRGTSAECLGDIFRKYTDKPVEVRKSAGEALAYAFEVRGRRKIYCLGSLYLTGTIKKLIQEGE